MLEPTKRHYDTIIVGGGTASGYAAFHYVEHGGARDELLILSKEHQLPYERPALSKGALAPDAPARLTAASGFYTCAGRGGPVCSRAWYEAHGVHVALGEAVECVNIDTASRRVRTAAQREFTCRNLILATGVRPRTIGDKAYANCLYLREYDDALALYETMTRLKASTTPKKVVVIGAGYIGLECTAALCRFGLAVELVYPHAHFLSRFFPPEIASYYETLYASEAGVTLTPNQRVVGFEVASDSSNLVTAVVCGDHSRVACDAVVCGVGDVPNVEFLDQQLPLARGGVQVNAHLETAISGVYAIGDVAAFPMGQTTMRLGHVDNARRMAACVMQQIVRQTPVVYTTVPYFYSRVFDCSWKFYGETSDEVVVFTHRENKPGAYWIQGDRVVGCFLEGGSEVENDAIRACAEARPKLEGTRDLVKKQGIAFALGFDRSSQ